MTSPLVAVIIGVWAIALVIGVEVSLLLGLQDRRQARLMRDLFQEAFWLAR